MNCFSEASIGWEIIERPSSVFCHWTLEALDVKNSCVWFANLALLVLDKHLLPLFAGAYLTVLVTEFPRGGCGFLFLRGDAKFFAEMPILYSAVLPLT